MQRISQMYLSGAILNVATGHAGRSNGSSSKRKSSRGADVGAQLSAAKSKLEEHLMRIAQEEPSSPEPEQASTLNDVSLSHLLKNTSNGLSAHLHVVTEGMDLSTIMHCQHPVLSCASEHQCPHKAHQASSLRADARGGKA